jgi:hypothetical protein
MFTSVIFDQLNDLADTPMVAVEVGVISIGDINADAVANLKPFH